MAYDTLSSLFVGICDSVRAKEGSTELINHQDIPSRIVALTSGGGGLANFATGKFTPTENISVTWSQYSTKPYSFAHGLSITPNFFAVGIADLTPPTWTGSDFVQCIRMDWRANMYLVRTNNTSGATATDAWPIATETRGLQADDTYIKFGSITGTVLLAGVTYFWIAGYVPLT